MADKNLDKSSFDVIKVGGKVVRVRNTETYDKGTVKTPFIKFLANKVEKFDSPQKIRTVK